jgi:WD40 repeat protein
MDMFGEFMEGFSCCFTLFTTFWIRRCSAPSVLSWEPQSRYMASGGVDGYLCIWDVQRGSASNVITKPHAGKPITALQWSADGRYIVTAGDDHTIRLWRVKPPTATAGALFPLCCSPFCAEIET